MPRLFRMVTFALAIVAPEGSLTKPEMVPRSDCANRDPETIEPIKHNNTATRQIFLIGPLLDDRETFTMASTARATSNGTTNTALGHHCLAKVPLNLLGFGHPTSRVPCHKSPENAIRFFCGNWSRVTTVSIASSGSTGQSRAGGKEEA